MACNIFKSGNYIEYTLNMIKDYWQEHVENMKNDKQLVKITTSELLDKIDYYTELVDWYDKAVAKKRHK